MGTIEDKRNMRNSIDNQNWKLAIGAILINNSGHSFAFRPAMEDLNQVMRVRFRNHDLMGVFHVKFQVT